MDHAIAESDSYDSLSWIRYITLIEQPQFQVMNLTIMPHYTKDSTMLGHYLPCHRIKLPHSFRIEGKFEIATLCQFKHNESKLKL